MKTKNANRRSDVSGQKSTFKIAIVLLALAVSAAQAQNFTLDWFKLAGGGGTSTGGVYSVTGTIGQPDAGTMSGSQFTLQGGFWPGTMVPAPVEVPTLYIQLSGGSVILSWSPATPGFALEASADLARASWTAAPAGNPVTIPVTGPTRFYRLKKP